MANNIDQVSESQNKLLRDCATLTFNGNLLIIRRPTINAANFKIKFPLISMIKTFIQFKGHLNDNSHARIINFLEIHDTLKMNRVSDNAIYLRFFLFSFCDKVKSWLNFLPTG